MLLDDICTIGAAFIVHACSAEVKQCLRVYVCVCRVAKAFAGVTVNVKQSA